jgi:hypothetical protein
MPDNEIASGRLTADGAILTPELKNASHYQTRIALEGTLRCSYNDTEFDAVYRINSDGSLGARHNYLQWTPREPDLESQDFKAHRYVFTIPAAWKLEGQSVGVRINADQFVNEMLIPPSDVKASLTDELRFTVLERNLLPGTLWPLFAWSLVPAGLAVGGVGWVMKRRRLFEGLSPDLRAALERIEDKHRAAVGAVRRSDARFLPVKQQLGSLRTGAASLARQIEESRKTQRMVNLPKLKADVESLRGVVDGLGDSAARTEAEATLVAKQKSLDTMKAVSLAESHGVLRLAKIESLLDTACLTLREMPTAGQKSHAEEILCRELDAELSALQEVSGNFNANDGKLEQVSSLL